MIIKQPNIIMIQSDSMDGRILGCLKHPAAFTPNLDELAKEGTCFTNTYCNSPQCVPSRASMWSGYYTHEIEGWNNYKGIPQGFPTFADELEEAGYDVACFGKTDYQSGNHSIKNRLYAWTRSAGILHEYERPKAQIRDGDVISHKKDWDNVHTCLDFLREYAQTKSNKPLFCYLGVNQPHPPFITTPYWLQHINRQKVGIPPFEEKLHPCIEYSSRCKNSFVPFSEQEILDIRQTYFAQIAETDCMIGKVLKYMREMGYTDENTIFIYTSDHGEMNMEHRLWFKNAMYEASMRVPLFISGPGILKGNMVDDPVSLIDIYPTLIEIAGIKSKKNLSGHSLIPKTRQKESEEDRRDVFAQYHSNSLNTGTFMLLSGRWKYIAYVGYPSQLFNLQDDPDEINDLSGTMPEMVEQMENKLKNYVDKEEIDRKVKQYDLESFCNWKGSIDKEEYEMIMKNEFAFWDQNQSEILESWIERSHKHTFN